MIVTKMGAIGNINCQQIAMKRLQLSRRTIMITCRYCGKEIAKGTESFKVLKRKLKSYDMYWFCPKGDCIDEYINNGEKPKGEQK